jgi:hypothetical protein
MTNNDVFDRAYGALRSFWVASPGILLLCDKENKKNKNTIWVWL